MPGIVVFHCPQEEKVVQGPNVFGGSDPPSDPAVFNRVSDPKTIPAAEPRPCNE